jgi:capsular polysaccharide transport system ATP-binding protein
MIEFEKVTKVFHTNGATQVILEDVDMQFPTKTNIAILGQNGAGKSTMMRLIAGADTPTRGTIYRHGRMSWPLGFGGAFNRNMTGMDSARFVARLYDADVDEVVEFVEDFSELNEALARPISTYSSGMKARLAFGISMAIDFDYYLIDETLSVGDKRFRDKCRDMFSKKLKHAHIIMISHSEKQIEEYCTSGIVLHNQKLLFFEDVRDAIEVHNMQQLKAATRQLT